jgi:hypothetical protein
MPPLVENPPTPAQAVTNQPADGETPPNAPATPVAEAGKRDDPTKEEKARALLKGEPPKDAAPDLSEEASIDAHFDPETDEFLDDEPTGTRPESGDRRPESEEAQGETPAPEAAQRPASDDENEDDDDRKDAGEDKQARRIRVKRDALSDRDFAILTLAKDKKITFAEAEAQLFGKAAPGDGGDGAAPPSRDGGSESAAQQINARIGMLRTAREKARESMDDRTADQLSDQIVELRDQLKEVHRFEAARAQNEKQLASQRYADAETLAINRASDLYPDARTAGSKLNEAMQAKATSLQTEDPRFFENPKWPLLLAVETATELGIAAKVKGPMPDPANAKPAAKVIPLAIPKKTNRPVPSPAPGTATSAKNNTEAALREQLKVATSNRDVEGIRAVIRKLSASA